MTEKILKVTAGLAVAAFIAAGAVWAGTPDIPASSMPVEAKQEKAIAVEREAVADKEFRAPDAGVPEAAPPASIEKNTVNSEFSREKQNAPGRILFSTPAKVTIVTPVRGQVVKPAQAQTPDVGPGVEGLDYSKVIVWQQNVDEGRELWRLDPLQAARAEGEEYGFSADARFLLVRQLESSALARHGEAHVKVLHGGKEYLMIMVRPFGADDGAIWTTHHVTGLTAGPLPQPDPNSPAKILFATDEFRGWKWRKTAPYPSGMAFGAVVGHQGRLLADGDLPAHVLEKMGKTDFDRRVLLFAYMGAAPSGGYGIGIEKVVMKGNSIVVRVRLKSPAPEEMVTQAVTFPVDFVAVGRSEVDIWGGVNLTFVDQDGTVLSKSKLVIPHR